MGGCWTSVGDDGGGDGGGDGDGGGMVGGGGTGDGCRCVRTSTSSCCIRASVSALRTSKQCASMRFGCDMCVLCFAMDIAMDMADVVAKGIVCGGNSETYCQPEIRDREKHKASMQKPACRSLKPDERLPEKERADDEKTDW